jgi:hypothetical protein
MQYPVLLLVDNTIHSPFREEIFSHRSLIIEILQTSGEESLGTSGRCSLFNGRTFPYHATQSCIADRGVSDEAEACCSSPVYPRMIPKRQRNKEQRDFSEMLLCSTMRQKSINLSKKAYSIIRINIYLGRSLLLSLPAYPSLNKYPHFFGHDDYRIR